MKVLIINPWPYTVEPGNPVHKVSDLDDTMIVGLATAFSKICEITLYIDEKYKPIRGDYPFNIVYDSTNYEKIFKPSKIPHYKNLKKFLKTQGKKIDLIICSEAFNTYTPLCLKYYPNKTIVWQEIAKHFNTLHGWASKIYYNFYFKPRFKNKGYIVPRSIESKNYISSYSNKVLDTIIDHGINLSNFIPAEKSNQFIIVSQLIERKRIDKSIIEFIKYNELVDSKTKLYIAGNGDQLENLQNLAKTSKYPDNIIFLGKLKHNELINYLAKSYAMLIYTTKDNNLISVVESLACNTPIVTNSVPYNATYIKNNGLGIVDDNWDYETLKEIVNNNAVYCNNCNSYREILSYDYKVKLFMNVYDKYIKS